MIKSVDNFIRTKGFSKDGVLTAIASTPTIDRDGEIVLPSAFKDSIANFIESGVILSSHIHRSLNGYPTIVGTPTRMEIIDNALEFDMLFAPTPMPQEWKILYEGGFAKAFSVGFIPLEGEIQDVDGKAVYTHTKAELLEISTVAVGSNPEALVKQLEDMVKAIENSGPTVKEKAQLNLLRLKVILKSML